MNGSQRGDIPRGQLTSNSLSTGGRMRDSGLHGPPLVVPSQRTGIKCNGIGMKIRKRIQHPHSISCKYCTVLYVSKNISSIPFLIKPKDFALKKAKGKIF